MATIHPLGADLAPLVFDMVASLMLVRVTGLNTIPPPSDGIEQGTLQLQVVEVYRATDVRPGQEITVAFSRVADPVQRERRPYDQWNNLDLDPGAYLLLATHPVSENTHDPLAAENVVSPAAPEVAELRAAVRLHAATIPPEHIQRSYTDAIVAGGPLLRRYALEAVANRGVVDRLPAVELLRGAVNAEEATAEVRLEIAATALEPTLFQDERHADRANRVIVGLLADGYQKETDPVNSVTWTKFLASVVLRSFTENAAEDRAVKESLVRGVDRGQWQRVRELLMSQTAVGAPDERALTSEVLGVWLLGTAER